MEYGVPTHCGQWRLTSTMVTAMLSDALDSDGVPRSLTLTLKLYDCMAVNDSARASVMAPVTLLTAKYPFGSVSEKRYIEFGVLGWSMSNAVRVVT